MLDREDYYLVNDPDFCVSSLRYGIHFLRHNWTPLMAGRPTVTTILQRQHLGQNLFLFSVSMCLCASANRLTHAPFRIRFIHSLSIHSFWPFLSLSFFSLLPLAIFFNFHKQTASRTRFFSSPPPTPSPSPLSHRWLLIIVLSGDLFFILLSVSLFFSLLYAPLSARSAATLWSMSSCATFILVLTCAVLVSLVSLSLSLGSHWSLFHLSRTLRVTVSLHHRWLISVLLTSESHLSSIC